MQIEIERKFLLKALPIKQPDDSIKIHQYYLKNKKIWERVRSYNSKKNGCKYIHTIKKSISPGVNMEDEKEISKQEYDKFISQCNKPGAQSRYIFKYRHIYEVEDGIKWEVDQFKNGYKLIIAEVEIPKKTWKLSIPDWINDVLLMEVTELKQFSNRNLSIDIKSKNKYGKS